MDDTDNTGRSTITKSELIEQLTIDQLHLDPQDVQVSVDALLDRISRSLINGERIEIRGFGSISLRYREPRLGRNPKTGEPVERVITGGCGVVFHGPSIMSMNVPKGKR